MLVVFNGTENVSSQNQEYGRKELVTRPTESDYLSGYDGDTKRIL